MFSSHLAAKDAHLESVYSAYAAAQLALCSPKTGRLACGCGRTFVPPAQAVLAVCTSCTRVSLGVSDDKYLPVRNRPPRVLRGPAQTPAQLWSPPLGVFRSRVALPADAAVTHPSPISGFWVATVAPQHPGALDYTETISMMRTLSAQRSLSGKMRVVSAVFDGLANAVAAFAPPGKATFIEADDLVRRTPSLLASVLFSLIARSLASLRQSWSGGAVSDMRPHH